MQALALLGRVRIVQGNYGQAQASLEQAIAVDPDNWMSHNLLGDVYLKQHEYEKAREQAQLAIDIGKEAANSARLVLAEALTNLGQVQQAIEALKMFVQVEPANPSVAHARELIAELEPHVSDSVPVAATTRKVVSSPTAADPLLAASELPLPTTAWQPPGVDEAKPSIASGVTCPYAQVIETTGERVKQLVDNVARFAAIEDLLHERLDDLGSPTSRETRKLTMRLPSLKHDQVCCWLTNIAPRATVSTICPTNSLLVVSQPWRWCSIQVCAPTSR